MERLLKEKEEDERRAEMVRESESICACPSSFAITVLSSVQPKAAQAHYLITEVYEWT